MTIRSQTFIALLTAGYACAQTPATFPLLKTCDSDAALVRTLSGSDHVAVRYSFAGDKGTCYSVTATMDGNPINGYLIGAAHPDIAAFELDVRTKAALIPPPPPPPPAAPPQTASAAAAKPAAKEVSAAPPEPAPPLSFAGFRATAINGDPVDLSRRRASNVVLYFWSARTARSIKSTEPVEAIYETYHSRGVDVVGIASAATASQLTEVCNANEVVWPQVLDSGGIASRYHVDPAKPYLLLDQSRNVIAAAPTAQALGPILDQITKNRRARNED